MFITNVWPKVQLYYVWRKNPQREEREVFRCPPALLLYSCHQPPDHQQQVVQRNIKQELEHQWMTHECVWRGIRKEKETEEEKTKSKDKNKNQSRPIIYSQLTLRANTGRPLNISSLKIQWISFRPFGKVFRVCL